MRQRQLPTLLFDGDCGFCRVLARHAVTLAGPRVHVVPYDQRSYPQVDAAQARAALQFLAANGQRHAGADTVVAFWCDAQPRWVFLSAPYRLPGMRTIAQRTYARIARRRRWG